MAIADMPRELFKSRNQSTEHREAHSSSGETPNTGTKGDGAASASVSREDVSQVQLTGSGASKTVTPPTSLTPEQSNQSHGSIPDSASMFTTSADTVLTSSSDRPPTRSSGSQIKEALSKRDSSQVGVGIEAAVGAGRSVGRVVGTGVKSPMNFCLGLAKGFRNVPRLYNDDTVRPVEKVTDISSGIRVAGKEFGFGLYDGISGLVMQPLKGAEKEGAGGLVKGVGKGIGGLITKPAAGEYLFTICHRPDADTLKASGAFQRIP